MSSKKNTRPAVYAVTPEIAAKTFTVNPAIPASRTRKLPFTVVGGWNAEMSRYVWVSQCGTKRMEIAYEKATYGVLVNNTWQDVTTSSAHVRALATGTTGAPIACRGGFFTAEEFRRAVRSCMGAERMKR